MLQDFAFGRLENEFRNITAQADDWILCFHEGQVLLCRGADDTFKQTVHREVMEEVGLREKKLRYYKSQPWGVDRNVLMGFFCNVDGNDAIRIDEKELSMADWYPRHALPAHDHGSSLTREIIRMFEEGMEPK